MIDPNLIEIVRSGTARTWGNVFLTNTWKLFIDMVPVQHDVAIERLGLDRRSIILSGYTHWTNGFGWVACFRSNHLDAVGRGELTQIQASGLIKAVAAILRGEPNGR